MKKVSIEGSNAYQQEFETFQESKLFKRLNDKFRVKPFYIQYKKLRTATVYTSYLFNLFSVLTSFFFVYSLLNSFLGLVLGLVLAIALLTTIEAFKRLILPSIFKNYLQFDKLSYLLILSALGLVCLSGFFSFNGGTVAVHDYTNEVEQINIDSIRGYYSVLIDAKAEQQKQLSKVKYKGTTTRTAQRSIEALQTEINSLRGQESKLLSSAISQNDNSILKNQTSKNTNGLYFSLLALLFDLVIVLCLAFLEYYDYRSLSEFGTIDNGKNNGNDNGNTATVSSGGNDAEGKEAEPKEVIKTVQVPIKKQCLNCSDEFILTNPKKKYCSTSCRVKDWEQKNNKVLSVPT